MTAPAGTALVTGATAGIGEAIAARLIGEGYKVIATGRRADRLDDLRARLGPNLLPVALDISDTAAIRHAIDGLPEAWREIDVLINNAGLAIGQNVAQDSDVADWDKVVATNISGLIHMTHAVLGGMVARDRGHIVNIGSVAADYAYPGGQVYAASKAFVHHFTLSLKADLIGTHVHVTTLAPGLVGATEFSAVRFAGDAERAQAVYRDLESLTPGDMADAVSWIVSRPRNVNVNFLEIMPTCQAPGPLVFRRQVPASK